MKVKKKIKGLEDVTAHNASLTLSNFNRINLLEIKTKRNTSTINGVCFVLGILIGYHILFLKK